MKLDAGDFFLIISLFMMTVLTGLFIEQNRNIKAGVVIVSSQAFICKQIPLQVGIE